MKFNLLEEKWIPVRRASGVIENIRPDQVVFQDERDPFVSFAATRPDFNAALMEFMIGLLQTCSMPANIDAWHDWYVDPPSPEILHESFAVYRDAFELIGDGPKFLQDHDEFESKETAIEALFIDSPGANTIKENKDHFVKSREGLRLTPEKAALALFTLQSMAPSGGQGHRTSMRGGGPWITVAVANTLWKSVWANVIDEEVFREAYPRYEDPAQFPEKVFPWLAPTQTSEKSTGKPVEPADGSPLQAYWGMPRRIRLLPASDNDTASSNFYFEQYLTKNYGIEYSGEWIHPLTPYRYNAKGEPSSIKGSQNTLSFQNWTRYAFADDETNKAALCIRTLQDRMSAFSELANELQLLGCGYDMDNMKARCWYEGLMPLLNVSTTLQPHLTVQCEQLIKSFDDVSAILHQQIRKALFGKYKPSVETGKPSWGKIEISSAGNIRLKAQAVASLEAVVEPLFYHIVEKIILVLETDSKEQLERLKLDWLHTLSDAAAVYFDQVIQPQSAAADHVSIARARRELRFQTTPNNKNLRKTLHISPSLDRATS